MILKLTFQSCKARSKQLVFHVIESISQPKTRLSTFGFLCSKLDSKSPLVTLDRSVRPKSPERINASSTPGRNDARSHDHCQKDRRADSKRRRIRTGDLIQRKREKSLNG
jgi:hypothetical protein